MVNPTIISPGNLNKKEAQRKPIIDDSIHLKPPPKGGAPTPSEILYDNDQIKAIVKEALDYYEKDFSSEQIIILIKNKYALSLPQATRVMYNAYMLNFNKVRLDTTWPYDLQLIISKAYGSTDLATIKLLKQGGDTPYGPFPYFYTYFLGLLNGYHPELSVKMSDFFKSYIEAGYTAEEVYAMSFDRVRTNILFGREERGLWVPNYVLGMKKAKVPAQDVIVALRTWGTFYCPGPISDILLRGGYTQTEINSATK